MSIKRTIRIATVTAVACAGLGTAISSPAIALSPVTTLSSAPAKPAVSPLIKLSNGPVKPTVRMTWKECWSKTYANARDSGSGIPSAEAEADLTCGKTQGEY